MKDPAEFIRSLVPNISDEEMNRLLETERRNREYIEHRRWVVEAYMEIIDAALAGIEQIFETQGFAFRVDAVTRKRMEAQCNRYWNLLY